MRGRTGVSRPGLALVLTLVLAVFISGPHGTAQVPGLVPAIPARERELDLFTREIGGGSPREPAVRILRYGRRGSLERPGALDIPQVGRAFILHAYDLLAPVGRTVEVRRMPGYRGWLEFEPGAFAIPLEEQRFELVYGGARWQTGNDDTSDLRVTAGPLLVRGRGEARLDRFPGGDGTDGLRLRVLRGRFEVLRGDELLAVLAPEQERRFALEGDDREGPVTDLALARTRISEGLEEATIRLQKGELPADLQAELWESVLELGPLYAHAEVNALPNVPHPDLLLRFLGEALRLLAAFSFTPPPYTGM